MARLVQAGLYIGFNGCSLKTQENLDVVKCTPLDKIMLEVVTVFRVPSNV